MKTTAVAKIVVMAALGSLMGITGCTKKRAERIAPGMGDNLQTVAAYNNKVYPVTTLNPVDKVESMNVTRSKNVNFNAKKYGLDDFAIVNYKTEAKLLGSTKLVARPNTQNQYEIHYQMTNDYLKVLKVAKEVDIPLQERSYAEKMADGRLGVPLLGYRVQGKYVLENIPNDIGQKTSLLREKSVLNIGEATHVRIDLASPEIFRAVQKPDLLPVSYFDGEWYYAETIVQTAEHNQEMLGFHLDTGIGSSTRIKFMKNKDTFDAVSLNVDERLKKQSDINFMKVFSLPVEWKEYRAIPIGNGSGMREEENNEISWDRRKFVLVNFEKVISAMSANSFDNIRSAKLINIELQDNYMSFTLEWNETNLRFKISLRRVEQSNYKPKVHFQDDWQRFGYFTTEKATIRNFEMHRKEDFEKNIHISRFNPQAEKIEFRFSKVTPAWLRPAVKRALLSWDDTFCRAFNGVDSQVCNQINKCKLDAVDRDKNNETCGNQAKQARYPQIVLNEKDGDVDLGDLRYNIINMIESESESNLFGFGPSLTDPYSGEIISATSNVHVTPIRSALVDELRNYKLMKLGYLSELRMSGASFLKGDSGIKVDNAKGAISIDVQGLEFLKDFKIPKAFARFFPTSITSKIDTPDKYLKIDFTKGNQPFGREFDLAVTSKNIHREIEATCPDFVKYVDGLKASSQSHSDRELELLNSCSRKLVLSKMTGTLVHELGHNFGLRHNFMGSNDTANFWPAAQTGGEVVRSSSTMEYTAFNEDRLTKPGLYDVAAIQYGYADRVSLDNGQALQLDPRKTIEQNVGSRNVKAYKFCTDEHTDVFRLDPMCRRHDAGTTPSEVVEQMINDYKTSYATLNVKYDRAFSVNPYRISFRRLANIMIPLKHFNEQWRIMIANYVGRDKMYLEGMDDKQYNEIANALMKDPKLGAEARELKKASDKAFEFLMSIVNMPNQYCLVVDSAGSYNLVELEKIRQESFSSGVNNVTSCTQESARAWFTSKGLQPVTQLGYPTENVKYDMRPQSMNKRFDQLADENGNMRYDFDITGTGLDRLFATQVLSLRSPLSMRSAQLGFMPNFLDIPEYRKKMIEATMNRVGQGVATEALTSALSFTLKQDDIQKLKAQKPFFSKFEFEKDLIEAQLQALIFGLNIPGKQSENMVRMGEFEVVRYTNPSDIKQVQQDENMIVIPIGQSALVMSRQQKSMATLAQSLMTASQMSRFQGFSQQVTQAFAKAAQALKLPANSAAAESMSALEYIMNFKEFAEALRSIPENLQGEMDQLLGNYPELAAAFNVYGQIAKLEQQAAIGSIDEFKEMIRAAVKAESPQATSEQIEQVVEQQVAQMSQMGLNAETLKQMSDQAKQQLAQAKQQLSQPASKVVGERLLTRDRLSAYMEARDKQIKLKIAEAELNRKDYEAQTDLIYSFLLGLSQGM